MTFKDRVLRSLRAKRRRDLYRRSHTSVKQVLYQGRMGLGQLQFHDDMPPQVPALPLDPRNFSGPTVPVPGSHLSLAQGKADFLRPRHTRLMSPRPRQLQALVQTPMTALRTPLVRLTLPQPPCPASLIACPPDPARLSGLPSLAWPRARRLAETQRLRNPLTTQL